MAIVVGEDCMPGTAAEPDYEKLVRAEQPFAPENHAAREGETAVSCDL